MTAHTPGPWRFAHRETLGRGYSTEVFDSEGQTIATMAWHAVPTEYGTTTDREENARLIAAAPDLLEALKSLRAKLAALESPLIDVCAVAALHGFDWTAGNWVRELESADAAIDKAEGK